jgi:hypothetical protein
MTTTMTVPELMPALARGKHRSPRQGACFMEMASFLAGERWSDHPACTHPLLATLARLVNDNTPDDERQHLTPLIPSVIGLNSADPRWDAVIARRAATSAIPVAAESRQRVLAVGLIACGRVFDQLDDRPRGTIDEPTADAIARVPLAWEWGLEFARDHDTISMRAFREHSAPSIVLTSVAGIAEACISDPAPRMRSLLGSVIDDCAALMPTGRADARRGTPATV